MKPLMLGGIVGILIGISIGSVPLRGQAQARYFIDAADELARKLDSSNPEEVNYARGYVAGSYDAWIDTTNTIDQRKKITSCVFTQKSLASSNIATIFWGVFNQASQLGSHTSTGRVESSLRRNLRN
jgi:hypothetical protein